MKADRQARVRRAVGFAAALIAFGFAATASGVFHGSSASADIIEPDSVVAPQLSIAISDDRDGTTAGDELDYTIVVENIGLDDAVGLAVAQNIPEGMAFGTADSGGTAASSAVNWVVDVKASEKVTLKTTMAVGKTPDDLLRLATVACAGISPTDPPIVCASDSDLLPAGAVVADSTKAPSPSTASLWLLGGSSAFILVIAALAVLLVRRRRNVRSDGRNLSEEVPRTPRADGRPPASD